MEQNQQNQVKNLTLPYQIMVEYENYLRQKADVWRFRCLTNVIRQSPQQIDKFVQRYGSAANLAEK